MSLEISCDHPALQALTESNSTMLHHNHSIGAFDLMSHASMLEALIEVENVSQAFPFVRLFFGQPSRYLLEDSVGCCAPHGPGRKKQNKEMLGTCSAPRNAGSFGRGRASDGFRG